MKLLLTSAGIKNTSIHNALLNLLGKPIAESRALSIPTALYGHPKVGPGEMAWRFISGRIANCPMCELGWKSFNPPSPNRSLCLKASFPEAGDQVFDHIRLPPDR